MYNKLILDVKNIEEKIIQMINESEIPAFIMRNSIENILNQLILIERQQLENAQKEGEKDGFNK